MFSDPPVLQEGDVSNFEEVETSSVDSIAASSVMLGDLLSVPLKHPYSPSLTSYSPLHGQPRSFSSDDYNLPPALEYEAPNIAAKPDCPSSLSAVDVSDGLCLSPSSDSSPLRPIHSVVKRAAYMPSLTGKPIPTLRQGVSVRFALLPLAYYCLVSPEIVSTIEDTDSKRFFYEPKLDEFVNDFGFPRPEVDFVLQGIDDISSVTGVISWGETRVVSERADTSPGPVTRSQSVPTTSSHFPPAADRGSTLLLLLIVVSPLSILLLADSSFSKEFYRSSESKPTLNSPAD